MAAKESDSSKGNPVGRSVVEVRLRELDQLFDHLDPAPFHERELNRDAEEYIVSTAKEFPHNSRLALVVHMDRPAGLPDEAQVLQDAVHAHFARQSDSSRQRLAQLFRQGRISLPIGLVCLAAGHTAGELIARQLDQGPWTTVLRESFVIGGWVAMWRPLETYLYDWWPILGEKRLYGRLSQMTVEIVYVGDSTPLRAKSG